MTWSVHFWASSLIKYLHQKTDNKTVDKTSLIYLLYHINNLYQLTWLSKNLYNGSADSSLAVRENFNKSCYSNLISEIYLLFERIWNDGTFRRQMFRWCCVHRCIIRRDNHSTGVGTPSRPIHPEQSVFILLFTRDLSDVYSPVGVITTEIN